MGVEVGVIVGVGVTVVPVSGKLSETVKVLLEETAISLKRVWVA